MTILPKPPWQALTFKTYPDGERAAIVRLLGHTLWVSMRNFRVKLWRTEGGSS